jgi:hypothetical protein
MMLLPGQLQLLRRGRAQKPAGPVLPEQPLPPANLQKAEARLHSLAEGALEGGMNWARSVLKWGLA